MRGKSRPDMEAITARAGLLVKTGLGKLGGTQRGLALAIHYLREQGENPDGTR